MKKFLSNIGLALIIVAALALSAYGVVGIHEDVKTNPLVIKENNESLIREVYAWYYEDGTIEDEQGQLWWWEDAEEDGQMWRLWINDNGTPADYTDDIVIDYTGG